MHSVKPCSTSFSSSIEGFSSPFINHQGWSISCYVEADSNRAFFQLYGKDGASHTTAAFIVQQLDQRLIDALLHAKQPHLLLFEYFERRLSEATPHQVHVERGPQGWVVRFGDYGLKGGGRKTAYVLSGLQIGAGSAFCISGVGVVIGTTLVSSGVSGGLYAYNAEEYDDREYAIQTACGLVSGAVSIGIEQMAWGAGRAAFIACRMIGNVASAVASKAFSDVAHQKKPSARALLNEALATIAGKTVSTYVSVGWDYYVTCPARLNDPILLRSPKYRLFSLLNNVLILFSAHASYALWYTLTSNRLENRRLSYQLRHSMLQTVAVASGLMGIQYMYEAALLFRKFLENYKIESAQSELKRIEKAESNFKLDQKSDNEVIKEWLLAIDAHEKVYPGGLESINISAVNEAAVEEQLKNMGMDIKNMGIDDWRKAVKEMLQRSTFLVQTNLILSYQNNHLHVVNEILVRQNFLHAKWNDIGLHILHGVEIGQSTLSSLFQKASRISFSSAVNDCSWSELANHVVLVHTINPEALIAALMDAHDQRLDLSRITDPQYCLEFTIQLALTRQGVLGSHLKLERRVLHGEIEKRPTIHWTWGQPVQPHGPNNWERSSIAVIEPMATFENSRTRKVYGIAPYDTLTLCDHQLSEHALVLVPRSCLAMAQAHLRQFRGTLIPYDSDQETLRAAVMRTTQERFPEMWHLCDSEGNLVGSQVRRTAFGYEPVTYMKKADGSVIALIEGEGVLPGEQRAQGIQELGGQRFIGLHIRSTTFMLEDTQNRYFSTLRAFKEHPETARDNPSFAAYVTNGEEFVNLGSLEALSFYQKLGQYDAATRVLEVANYVISEAIGADLFSICLRTGAPLSSFDLRMVLALHRPTLIRLLENMQASLRAQRGEEAGQHFADYRAQAELHIRHLVSAKEEVNRLVEGITPVENEISYATYLFFRTYQEWANVRVPEEIAFDLERQWPLDEELHAYVQEVTNKLPQDQTALTTFYQEMLTLALPDKPPQERYRALITMSVIKQLLYEMKYCERYRSVL